MYGRILRLFLRGEGRKGSSRKQLKCLEKQREVDVIAPAPIIYSWPCLFPCALICGRVSLTSFSLQVPFLTKLYLSALQEYKVIMFDYRVISRFLYNSAAARLVSHVSKLIFVKVSLVALLDLWDLWVPSLLHCPVTWCRTYTYFGSDLFLSLTTAVSDSSPCMFILSHPPPSFTFQDLAYFLQPRELCLPSVSDALLALLPLLCWVLICSFKHLFSLYSALSPSFLLPPRFPPLLLPSLQDKPAWWDVLEEQAVYY